MYRGFLFFCEKIKKRVDNLYVHVKLRVSKYMYVQAERSKEKIMSKFKKDAARLLELVGGKENIQAVTHCVTRMRFVLIDPEKADVDSIEDLDSAKGTFT